MLNRLLPNRLLKQSTMKVYKVYLTHNSSPVYLTRDIIDILFTEGAITMIGKVGRQTGRLTLSKGSLKNQLVNS